MSEVPVQDFFEIASHKVALACHNLWVHKQSKCVQIQSILIKYENQELHKMCPNNPEKIYGHVKTSRMRLNFTANNFVYGCANRGIAPRTFSLKLAGRELPKCV